MNCFVNWQKRKQNLNFYSVDPVRLRCCACMLHLNKTSTPVLSLESSTRITDQMQISKCAFQVRIGYNTVLKMK